MADCIFCRIVAGEVEAFKVYEDDDSLAFLDINPAAPGHTLVVTKVHAENIFDIDEIDLRRLVGAVKHVAAKIRAAIGSDIMVVQNNGSTAGQVVDHIHFHIIPRTEGDGIGLARGRVELSREQLQELAEKIKTASV